MCHRTMKREQAKIESVLSFNSKSWHTRKHHTQACNLVCFYATPGIASKLTRREAKVIGLDTVLEAIVTSRQTHEKLQCLYENLMSNNFCKTAVKLHSKGFF